MSIAEKRLADLGLQLFDDDVRIQVVGNKPKGETPYRTGRGICKYKIHEDLLFISAMEPTGPDGKPAFVGRLGGELSVEEGYRAARLVAINMLTIIKDALGDLDNVECILKVYALVNGVPGFGDLPQVADGFTDLMTEVFGERGMHARSDMGATNLNNNVPIVCDAIIQIRK